MSYICGNCRYIGPTREWHLVLAESSEDITFGFVSWFHQSVIRFGSPFFFARFKAGGPVNNSVTVHIFKADGIPELKRCVESCRLRRPPNRIKTN